MESKSFGKSRVRVAVVVLAIGVRTSYGTSTISERWRFSATQTRPRKRPARAVTRESSSNPTMPCCGRPATRSILRPGHTGGHSLRVDTAQAALMAGKDVLVEKPLAVDVKHGEDLVRIAEQNGRILMVGHILRYHPAILKLKQLI